MSFAKQSVNTTLDRMWSAVWHCVCVCVSVCVALCQC